MSTISIPLEVSILLDLPYGVSLYTDQEEFPTYSVPLKDLVNDWVEAFSVDGTISESAVEEAYEIIKQLRDSIAIISQALPE